MQDQDTSPMCFLSLEVENIRCFGEKQTLDLSDGAGRPAQWKLLLGDNGVVSIFTASYPVSLS